MAKRNQTRPKEKATTGLKSHFSAPTETPAGFFFSADVATSGQDRQGEPWLREVGNDSVRETDRKTGVGDLPHRRETGNRLKCGRLMPHISESAQQEKGGFNSDRSWERVV